MNYCNHEGYPDPTAFHAINHIAQEETKSMPRKPPHPCNHPGCKTLTDKRFCARHQQEEDHLYNHDRRDREAAKAYDSIWRKVRMAFLAEHPLCARCETEGRLTPATLVHHVKPLRAGGGHDSENLMALCRSCHETLHTKRGERF
jgi:5-methylcytosine-specific restriction protein A